MLKIKTEDTKVALDFKDTTPIEMLVTISALYEYLMRDGTKFQDINKIVKKTQKIYKQKLLEQERKGDK